MSSFDDEEAEADRLEIAGSLIFVTLIAWLAIEAFNLGI